MPNLNKFNMYPSAPSGSISNLSPMINRQNKFTLTDLRNDKEFQKKSERFLTSLGERGTVEDMFEYFRGTDFNIWDAGKLALQSNKFTDEQKQDYNYLRNKFDNADLGGLWEGVKATGDIGYEILTDPTMLASVFFVPWTGGTSVAARAAAGKAVQSTLKKLANKKIAEGVAKGVAKLPGQTLKAPLSSRAKTTILSTEGFIYGSSLDYLSQEKDVNTDRLEDVNLKQSLAMGAVTGTIPVALRGAGLGISKFNKSIQSRRAARIDGGEDYKFNVFDKGLEKIDKASDAIMAAIRPTSRALTAFVAKPTSRFISKMKDSEPLDNLIKLFRYDTGRSMTGKGYDVAQKVSKRSYYENVNTYNGSKAEALREILKGLSTKGTVTIPRWGSSEAFFKIPFTKRSKTVATKQTRGSYQRISDETNEALAYFLRTGSDKVTIGGKIVPLDKAFKLTEHTTKQITDAGKQIRNILDVMHADAETAGLKFGKITNYLPRSFNYYAVKQEIKNLQKGEWGALAKELRAKEGFKTREDVLQVLRDINDPFSRVGKSYTRIATIGSGKTKTTPSLSKERKLLNIDETNISEYLDNSIGPLLQDYIQQAGAYIQRKIHLGEDLADFNIKFINPIIDDLKTKGKVLTDTELKTLERIYLVTTGQMSNFNDGFISAATKRTLSDIVTVTNQMALLPFATITSFAEVAVPLVRGAGKKGVQRGKGLEGMGEGGIRSLWKTAADYRKMWWNDVVKKDLADARPEALKELNRFNRAVDRAGEDRALAMYGQGFGRKTTLLQNKFFKFNLLHDWTRFVQLTSFHVAKSKMYENLFELSTNKNIKAKTKLRLENELKELGVDVVKGIKWVEAGGKPSGKFYDDSFLPSAARYVDEVIMNPTSASNQKPLWHSMPSTRWAFGLLGFPTAFSNTVLKNAVREVSKDVRSGQLLYSTPSVVMGLTTMTGITMFGNTLRTGGRNLEEIEEGKKDIGDEVWDALMRAGLFGPTEQIIRAKGAMAYDNFLTAVTKRFTGPAVDDIINLTKNYEGLLTFAIPKIPGMFILRTTNPEAYKDIMTAARKVDITRASSFAGSRSKKEKKKTRTPIFPAFSKGGVVKDVPRVPEEPDERIDKMTGLPYNVQAGKAFIDEEDPEKRESFFLGSTVSEDRTDAEPNAEEIESIMKQRGEGSKMSLKDKPTLAGKDFENYQAHEELQKQKVLSVVPIEKTEDLTKEGRAVWRGMLGDDKINYSERTVTFPTNEDESKWVTFPSINEKGQAIPEDQVRSYVIEHGPIDPITGEEFPVFPDRESAVEYAEERRPSLKKDVDWKWMSGWKDREHRGMHGYIMKRLFQDEDALFPKENEDELSLNMYNMLQPSPFFLAGMTGKALPPPINYVLSSLWGKGTGQTRTGADLGADVVQVLRNAVKNAEKDGRESVHYVDYGVTARGLSLDALVGASKDATGRKLSDEERELLTKQRLEVYPKNVIGARRLIHDVFTDPKVKAALTIGGFSIQGEGKNKYLEERFNFNKANSSDKDLYAWLRKVLSNSGLLPIGENEGIKTRVEL